MNDGLTVLAAAIGLVVLTVAIHAAGFDLLLRAMMRADTLTASGIRRVGRSLIVLACWLVLIHVAEIAVWALFYLWQGGLPDAESALYLSGSAYSGGGDGTALPKPGRLLVPLEALIGSLMFGLSTGLFFAVVYRWIVNWMQKQSAAEER
ncbi:MAG TPA: hypothetical protein VMU46_11330 [Burkholderiales bacterium]|nr:hypothetical protein [Burkholderiales bacterium]